MRSNLGQPLNVQVPISGASPDILVASCIKAKVETIDGEFIASPLVEFVYPGQINNSAAGNLPTRLNFVTKAFIIEPAVTLFVSMACGTFIQRTYTLLLDYPEITAPTTSAISTTENTELKKTIPTPVTTNLIRSAPAKKTSRTQVAGAEKKSTSVVHRKKQPSKKPSTKLNPGKDALKLSKQEVLSSVTPAASPKLEDQKPIDINQQRIQENNLAQERFAAMLRGESSLLETQASNLKNEQLKIQKLENEIELLKLQLQSRSVQDKNLPMIVIAINVIALLLLLIIGMLWFFLRKMRQQQNKLWWDFSTGNKRQIEAIVDELQEHADKGRLNPGPTSEAQKNKIDKQNQSETSENPSQTPVTPPIIDDIEKLPALEDTNSSSFNLFTNRRGQSIQIEELSDSTQEAEFWVSINDPKRAIEILEPQSYDSKLSMPVTLLYLLDLYRLVGDEVKYNKLRVRLKQRFNTNIPHFNEIIDQSNEKHLEDYEHLISRCCAFWNTNYILPFLESLIIDDREGARVGFELSVYRDILFLVAICKELDRTKDMPMASK